MQEVFRGLDELKERQKRTDALIAVVDGMIRNLPVIQSPTDGTASGVRRERSTMADRSITIAV
jgi:hypothetical protein